MRSCGRRSKLACFSGDRAIPPAGHGHLWRTWRVHCVGMLTSAAASSGPADSSSINTMAFDPSTLCARTSAGEEELATPTRGLALGQRRVLTLLQSPAAVAELAQKHHLEPEKLARDLA